MRDAMAPLLDGLSELVYISDPDSYRLLYLNRPGKEIYGFDADDGEHACYEVLQGLSAPCSFCTNDRLNRDSFLEWEHTSPLTNRHYLLRDKLIEWEGRLARLEIAFDITDRKRESESYRFLADANALNVECVRLLENGDLDRALNMVLGMLGAFLEADRSYLFHIEDDRMSNTYEWCADGVTSEIENLQNLPLSLIDHWLERFSSGDAVIINDVDDLVEQDRADEYEVLSAQGISSLVAVPLEEHGKLVGYLGVDDPRKSQLEIVEKPLVGLASFISACLERALTRRKVDELMWTDSLTGTRSRGAFHHDYGAGMFERLGFFLVDADRLSVVNREQGRSTGDAMLQDIASCLRAVFGDCVYRIGDDEFCAVKGPISFEEFNGLAAAASALLAEHELPASAGSAWSERCDDAPLLLDIAGDRMRRAKRGRHRAEDLGVNLATNVMLSDLIRPGGAENAVATGKLDIYLMPQISTTARKLVGAEALIRYLDPAHGEAQPAAFIPALEDMGEVAYVDFFALSRACETIARWRREGAPVVPVSVNFSRVTVGIKGFVDYVRAAVSNHGIDPSLIEIEVTESSRGHGGDLLRRVAKELRSSGFRVAIDDFGVDNANVSLFVQLEFDVLKLDKSLVEGLEEDERTVRVVSSVARLCEDLGLQSVAEGIESQEQLEALAHTCCTRAQGYLIGKPVPIGEFERLHLHRAR